MRIGLLSDTHGWLDPALEKHFAACDEIWHAGDIGDVEVTRVLADWKPLRAVHGNIDGALLRSRFPADMRFTLAGMRVWITHIGGRPPRYAPGVREALSNDPPGLFICGHSHILLVQHDAALGCLHMTPGAAGRHGWHRMRTALRFRLAQGGIHDLEVIELGPRARG
jgi:putative phosphoesterase